MCLNRNAIDVLTGPKKKSLSGPVQGNMLLEIKIFQDNYNSYLHISALTNPGTQPVARLLYSWRSRLLSL